MVLKEYNPVIYPLFLWVCIKTDETDELKLSKLFNYKSGESYTGGMDENTAAITFTVSHKSGKHGVIVTFSDAKSVDVRNITHESCHVSDKFWHLMGEDTTGGEANAYLTGWVAHCIEQTLKEYEKVQN